ncbi:hypothetical protein [Streptomyces sioyaensis]|uniref:hypothetical protein n=1 Tax=Streptomyces TaxID=1883 RepID=UPI0036EE4C82
MNVIKTHPARVYALVVALLGLLAAYGVNVAEKPILGVVGAALALISGEFVQRTEDGKTSAALATPVRGHANLVGE